MYLTYTGLLYTARSFHNLSLPLLIQPHSVVLCASWDTQSHKTHAMVVLNYGPWVILLYCIFIWFLWVNTVFALAFVLIMLCLLHCSPPHTQGCRSGSCPFSVVAEAEVRHFYRFRIGYLTWKVNWRKSFDHFPMWIKWWSCIISLNERTISAARENEINCN